MLRGSSHTHDIVLYKLFDTYETDSVQPYQQPTNRIVKEFS